MPSLVHVTVVAGEPVEVQLRVNSDPKFEVASRDVMDTGAIGKYDSMIIIHFILISYY